MNARKVVIFAVFALAPLFGARAQQWWDADWSHRRQLVFDAASTTQPLADFPVLVILDASRIDYALTQDTGALDDQDAAAVWSNGYVGVWHLDETSGVHDDSSPYANTGTTQGGTTMGATGKIDGADDFDGSGDGIAVPSAVDDELSALSALTIEAWMHIDTYALGVNIVGKAYGSVDPFSVYTLALGVVGQNNFYVRVSTDGGSDRSYSVPGSLSTSGFYYLVGTWNGATIR
jgi:hypothetical protein